jgi:hypothetical protein
MYGLGGSGDAGQVRDFHDKYGQRLVDLERDD